MNFIDLHVHSNASDGTLTPKEVVELAVKKNLAAFALTDHDSIDGVREAMDTANEFASTDTPIRVIPGMELSVAYKNRDIHILGLFIDIHNTDLIHFLDEAKMSRQNRNEKMVDNLRNAGLEITMADLLEGNADGVITRAHFAKHLMKIGAVKNNEEAFRKYLDSNTPYYVPRTFFSPEDAIRIIHNAGGIASLAHPMLYGYDRKGVEKMVAYLKPFGLDALETYYSSHTVADEFFVRNLAKREGLLFTGGSDFHGANKRDIELGTGRGKLKVPYDLLASLESRRSI